MESSSELNQYSVFVTVIACAISFCSVASTAKTRPLSCTGDDLQERMHGLARYTQAVLNSGGAPAIEMLQFLQDEAVPEIGPPGPCCSIWRRCLCCL